MKKELLQKDLKLLMMGSVTGVAICLSGVLCFAMLMERAVLGAGEYGLYAKLSLALGTAGAAAYICLRIKKDRLSLTLLSNAVTIIFLLFISMLCGAGQCDYLKIGIDIAVGLGSSFLVCAVASKSAKRTKIKRARK